MYFRWIGAVLIIGSCSGFAFSITIHQMRELRLLEAVERMINELAQNLSFQMHPLPQLLQISVQNAPKPIAHVINHFINLLDNTVFDHPETCMKAALQASPIPYQNVSHILLLLGHSLGTFDLEGQLKELDEVKSICRKYSLALSDNQASRFKLYRILGICSGISLVILLI